MSTDGAKRYAANRPPVITVLYSCPGCGLKNVSCEVYARTTEDVIFWVENVMGYALVRDHHRRSPECAAQTMRQVTIPMTGASKVGGAVEN
jgi:hypothetical protein